MTDAAYCALETERERKSLARMSRYKKNGSRTNYVRLPQTNMTESEWKKMNGKVETISLNKPMTKHEFKALPKDLKKEYLWKLYHDYDASSKDVADMLGYDQSYMSTINVQVLGRPAPIKYGKARDKDKWQAFLHPEAFEDQHEAEMAETYEEQHPSAADALEAKYMGVKFEPEYNIGSISFSAEGDPAIIFERAMALVVHGEKYRVDIRIRSKEDASNLQVI